MPKASVVSPRLVHYSTIGFMGPWSLIVLFVTVVMVVVVMMIVTDGGGGCDDDSDRWSWWL